MERTLSADDPKYNGIPYIGCPATQSVGSDSYPGTIVAVSVATVEHTDKNGITNRIPKRVVFKRCGYRGVEGHSNAFTESQKYEYFDSDNTSTREYSWRERRKNYVEVGTSWRASGVGIYFGYRRAYRDPSF